MDQRSMPDLDTTLLLANRRSILTIPTGMLIISRSHQPQGLEWQLVRLQVEVLLSLPLLPQRLQRTLPSLLTPQVAMLRHKRRRPLVL